MHVDTVVTEVMNMRKWFFPHEFQCARTFMFVVINYYLMLIYQIEYSNSMYAHVL